MSVLQPWLESIPIRMQSTLILGLRGPDTRAAPNIKLIARWLRGVAFRPGNPDNVLDFMAVRPPSRIIEKSDTAKELEFCPMHYFGHLMHALEVVGYRHPNFEVASSALGLFVDLCELLHLPVEPQDDFEARLCTRDWPGGRQPDDAKEAAASLAPAAPHPEGK